ncbi:hypothetical protein POSPLADRAFT_1060174 [Postia placenta MAD-698-R-SB12]|uniref:Putative gamma-glutamylcyclotransferase n=1 Tax=Postia placenta MAD-698-R-SB12 TaxID=670580 RepID=A0A1X6MRU4_9APHY|nr:hypothetical protein POSPLADRAFT_1060174 [Postia placenta MAD-698-R-SB12]OSX59088.1 hypothetical protein POSPLADRAFT_1060174 [Postia placenta MAD-698-R-SB12]
MSEPPYSAFFYGTLLHPAILRRVIGHDGQHLQICPALLLEHTRHQVKCADYPAVLPWHKNQELLSSAGASVELPPESRTVRGTLVTGLSTADIALLDIFEGNEYTRERVSVHPLGPFTDLSASVPDSDIAPAAPAPPSLDTLAPPLPAHTYIWGAPLDQLSPEVWDYADFVRKNAWKWVGDAARNNADYLEVDRRRAMNGDTLRQEIIDVGGDDTNAKAVVEVVET